MGFGWRLLTLTSILSIAGVSCSLLSLDAEGAKTRPVSKVIKLLKDMLHQLQKESDEDEEVYDAMACWCETNSKEKTASISAAEARISDLTSNIEDLTAKSAGLNTEIKSLEKERAVNQGALAQATSIREKQLSEFNGEEKDLVESIAALKAAIIVLSKKASSLLQTSQQEKRHLTYAAHSLRPLLTKHADLLASAFTHSERRAVASFIQAQDYFDATPTFKQAYAPQSGEILGVLKQMKETFESNLSASQKEEIASQEAYESVNKAKKAEIAAGSEQIDKKTMTLAITDEKNAQAKEDLDDTRNALSADETFLQMLKEKCSGTDKEHEERKKTRSLEIEAVSKALSLLSSDDAHDLFTKTFNAALLQRARATNSQRRSQASKVLTSMAQKLHSSTLSALAVKVRLDAFTTVKKAIDALMEQLLEEKADEIKHKDVCVDEFNENQLQTEKAERQEAAFTAKIDDLQTTIKGLTGDIGKLTTEVNEMRVQMKRASEDREKENRDFQLTIADQRATQQLLVAALKVLKQFYAKAEAAFLQREEPVGPAPPPGFQEYTVNEKSSGVTGLIQQIIDDAKTMEHDATVAEADAQKAYEAFVKATNESIYAKVNEITNKSENKAKAESDMAVAKDGQESADDMLDSLAKAKADLHTSCDFVLKNFEIRQSARDEEIEALKQAKSILSGANFESFIQGRTA